MADTVDRYERAADAYYRDIHEYNEKVRRGRSVTRPDLNDPKFSPEAEELRQVSAISRANALQSAEDLPSEVDLGEPQGNTLPDEVDLSEGDSVRSKGIGSQALDFLGNLVRPRTTLEDLSSPEFLNNLALGATGGAAMGGLAGPGGAVAGGIAGALSAPLAFEGYKREVEKFVGMGYSLEEAKQKASISSMMLGLGSGMAGPPRPTRPITPVPKQLTHPDLDIQIAERALHKTAYETGAFPDPELVPSVRRGTGSTIVAPSLDPGTHGDSIKGPVVRGAKGQMTRPGVPVMSPGEYGEGEQLSMLGGYNVLGEAPHLTGKYVLTPEEQMAQGMIPLREQRTFIPERPADYTSRWNELVSKTLKTRILTMEEEDMLSTPLAEQGRYPIELKTSATGRAVSAGPKVEERFTLPKEFNSDNTLGGAVFTSKSTRAFSSVIDAMRRSGPVGEGMASLFDMAYTNRAIGTSSDMVEATKALDTLLGVRGYVSRKIQGMKEFFSGENPFIFGMGRYWNLTPQEEESLFNYMYTQRRMTPLNDRVKEAGEILFEHGLYPASSDPGVRMLHINNPFTGRPMPLGEPGMFMPQQPVNPLVANAINDTQWGILYERAGGNKLGVSLETFKKTIIALSSHDPEVTAFKMKGLENMRLLDLEALGGSPYQWAKKLGYETDPFRATFRFNSLARLRGQLEQIREPVNSLLQSIPSDAGDATKWLHLAADRAMLNPGKYDTLQTTTNTLKGISHAMDISMLQLGGVANLAQTAFVTARGGVRASLKGFRDLVTGNDRELIEKSGAVFPAALNELTNPTGPMATFSSGAFRLYGLSLVDRNTRYFAGHVGNNYIKQIEANFLKNPTSQRLGKMLEELGGDPKAILQQGSIPDDMRLAMIQKFANYTSGVTDVRGVPLWASSENPWARLINKYRTFAVANSAEVRRLVGEAPTAYDAAERVAKLVVGAYAIGGGINEGRKALREMLMGANPNPSKNEVMQHAERLVQGLGTIEGMFIINAANRPENAVLSIVGGPAAGVAGGIVQDMVSTAQHGVGWRTIDTLSKRVPIVGPITGPLVGAEVKRESKWEAEKERILRGD